MRHQARTRRLAAALSAGTALVAPAAAQELPTGGEVVRGAASIATPAPGRMTIDQTSDRAVLNWRDFSIGEGGGVHIAQPSAGSAMMNRVTGPDASRIAGRLTADGRVYLVNPNGVVITRDGTVRAGAFVASSLGMADRDFMAGRDAFRGTGRSAAVANHGAVEIGRGGYAALIGGRVENTGTISVPLGRIGLAAGEAVTLDLSGDGFLSVAVPSEGEGDLIAQSGRLSADGGRVEMRAATARDAARRAVNLSGVVEARTVGGRSGAVVLGGGPGGTVRVSGRVEATARVEAPDVSPRPEARPETRPVRGGRIDVAGQRVLLEGATLDASGRDGGGTVRVGGDLRGGDGLPGSALTAADAGTRIAADALGSGDGGTVVLWSDGLMAFEGAVSARGGPRGGDGGFAEVSGRGRLAFGGTADLSAPMGVVGTLLLDPADITIVEEEPDPPEVFETDFDEDGVDEFLAGAGEAEIAADRIEEALGAGNVVLTTEDFDEFEEDGDITVAAPLTWSTGTTLTFEADADVVIDAPVTLSGEDGAGFVVEAGDGIVVGAAITAPAGTLDFAAGADVLVQAPIALAGGSLGVEAGGALSIDAAIDAPGAALSLVAGDGFSTSETISVEDGDLSVQVEGSAALGGAIEAAGATLDLDVDAITVVTDGDTDGGVIEVGGDLTLSAPLEVAGGILAAASEGPMTLGGPIAAEDATLEFEASEALTTTAPIAGGGATLAFAADAVQLGAAVIAPGGALTVAAQDAAVLAGGVSMPGGTLTLGGAELGDGEVSTPTFEAPGPVEVGTFVLAGGAWTQIGDPLPAFEAEDFRIGGNTFLRLEGAGEAPPRVVDVFGLQGVGSDGGDGTALLGADIDASGTAGWNDGAGFVPLGGEGEAAFAGELDGGGFTVTGLTIAVTGEGSEDQAVGLIREIAPGGAVRRLALRDVDVTGGTDVNRVGGLAGISAGTVEDVLVTGAVRGIDSTADLDDEGVPIRDEVSIGGLAGVNTGEVLRSFADVAVVTETFGDVEAGGLVGSNLGFVVDSYARGSLSLGDSPEAGVPNEPGQQFAGGLAGRNAGLVERSYAAVPVEDALSEDAPATVVPGGLVATSQEPPPDFPSPPAFGVGMAPASFWDAEVGPSGSAGGQALTTAQLTDTATFLALAEPQGWDFAEVWAPPGGGEGPALYASSPVIRAEIGDVTAIYGSLGDAPAAEVEGFGGPGVYLFGPEDDAVALPEAASPARPDAPVGTVPIGLDADEVVSEGGVTYRLVALDGTLTIAAAPLTIVVPGQDKAYGEVAQLAFDPVEGLLFGDMVTGVALSSPGAPATAPVAGSPYAIEAGSVEGVGLSNYDITVETGALSVDPRAATVTADDRTKIEGEALALGGTAFTVENLADDDAVTSVTLQSDGAPAEAPAGSFAVVASDPVGQGLVVEGVSNYAFAFEDGTLTVAQPDMVAGETTAARQVPPIALPDPPDVLGLGGGGPIREAAATRVDPVVAAEDALAALEGFGAELEAALAACRRSDPGVEAYLDCLGRELDRYAARLDQIALELPEPLRGVSAVIREAGREVRAIRSDAADRLAAAGTEAERERIGREAIEEARGVIRAASLEVQQAIDLVFVEEPRLARVYTEQGDAIQAALDAVDVGLVEVGDL